MDTAHFTNAKSFILLPPILLFSTVLFPFFQGGVAHFGGAFYEQLLHTEDTKYRLSRAHFYEDQFILARTGEVSRIIMVLHFHHFFSSEYIPGATPRATCVGCRHGTHKTWLVREAASARACAGRNSGAECEAR